MSQSPPKLATLRMIVTAIVVGSCFIGGAVIFSASRLGGKLFADPLVGLIEAGVGLLVWVVQFALPRYLPKPARDADESTLMRMFGQEVLIRVFLLETTALNTYVVYLFSQNEVVLVTGVVLVATILWLRPSERRYLAWKTAHSVQGSSVR